MYSVNTYTVQVSYLKMEQRKEKKDTKLFMVIYANNRLTGNFFFLSKLLCTFQVFSSDYVLFSQPAKTKILMKLQKDKKEN